MDGAVRKERVGRGLAMRIAWVRFGRTWSVASAMWLGCFARARQRLPSGLRWMAAALAKNGVFSELDVPIAARRGAPWKDVGRE
jgi:hypothetical protein